LTSSDIEDTLDKLQNTDDGTRAPSREQWRQHLEAPDEPFVVVNLLSLADEDYLNQYASKAVPAVLALGAELIYMGRGEGMMIGDEGDGCDVVSIWRWPSRSAWTNLWLDPDYAEIRPLFNQGVQRYRCVVTKELQAV